MNIGIIGAGNIGATLAEKWVKLGHKVTIANSRGPDTLQEVAAHTGATPVTVTEAAQNSEVVVITIPELAVTQLPKDLFAGVADEVVIIDTGNYYPARDGHIAAIADEGSIESAWVAAHIQRPVIKAFNNIYSKSLLEKGLPQGTTGRIALSVAGDSPEAREKVLRLVDALGFDPVDAGNIAESWRQQPGTPSYCHDLEAEPLKAALAAAEFGRIAEYRDAANEAVKAYF